MKTSIEPLKAKDIPAAARIYNRGLARQVPPGRSSLNNTIAHLQTLRTFVSKNGSQINGLISFTTHARTVTIEFICASQFRQGTGKQLLKRLAEFCAKKRTMYIYSTVSSKDWLVQKFYNRCGFRTYGTYAGAHELTLYKIRAKPAWVLAALETIIP